MVDAELRIRSFEARDQPAVWELHNTALAQVEAHGGNGPWDRDLSDPVASYLASDGEFLVGTLAGRIIAMGALLPSSETRAEIKRMRVHPDQQRRGFGARILLELERRAHSRGFQVLQLDTTAQQVAARRLYEAHGYREVRRGRLGRFELIYYEKSLGPGMPREIAPR